MAFPSSPALGSIHIASDESYVWDGSEWIPNYTRDARSLAGYHIIADTPAENDLLRFNSGAWRTVQQTEIVEGGGYS